jgi:ankyrin repeat protein
MKTAERIDMKEVIYDILSLPRQMQADKIEEMSKDEDFLKDFAAELLPLAKEKGYKFGALVQYSRLPVSMLKTNITQLLKQFPEVADTRLALDREFPGSKEKINAIIDDLNADRIPISRLHELLHVNFFDNDPSYTQEGKEIPGTVSRTFLGYALPKIVKLDTFLTTMREQLGAKEFDSYMNTPNYLSADLKVPVGDLYLKDHGAINSEERAALSEGKKKILRENLPTDDNKPVVRTDNVDTHNVASHKTGDESHVTAFKMMVEVNGLTVDIDYEAPAKTGDPSRSVKINDKGNLDQFVTSQISELKKSVDRLVQMDDAGIYNEYLRYGDIKKFETIEYKDLEAKDKESFAKKIGGLRFQTNAAKRYIDNMVTDHQCNSGNYQYRTDVVNSCGLTMEQMIAASYWASKDKANFKSKDVTEQGNFLSLAHQVYDMRRGYDADGGIDKPDELKFPASPGVDHNRCAGGGINSLSWALASAHIAYNPKKIESSDIERELSQLYEKIIADHVDDIKNIASPEERNIWAANNKATGNVRDYLNNIFQSEYLQDFESNFKGYVPDDTFHATIEQGLDNIKMPEAIGVGIEEMSFDDIKSAISEELLPLLHLDQEHGYESTLNYLDRLHPQERLIENLCDFAVGNSTPNAIATLSFLSRSNLAEEYKNVEILKIKDVLIKLSEIGSLISKEIEVVYTTEPDNLIEACIAKDCPNLFELYCRKIGLSAEELTKGYDDEQLTPLHYAVIHVYDEVVRVILGISGIDTQNLLEAKDINGQTALHLAARRSQANIIKVILETPGVDKQKLLEIQNENGNTALHLAANIGQVEVIKAMLETDGIDKQKLLEIQGEEGYTALHMAVVSGHVGAIKVILEAPGIDTQKLFEIQNRYGKTALQYAMEHNKVDVIKIILHWAAHKGQVEVIKAILETPGVDTQKLLEMQDKQGISMLHLAANEGRVETIKAILETPGVDTQKLLEMQDKQGLTALNWAVDEGQVEAIKVILETPGIDTQKLLEIQNEFGRTAFHTAMYQSNAEAVKAILGTPGIDTQKLLEMKDKQGLTACVSRSRGST